MKKLSSFNRAILIGAICGLVTFLLLYGLDLLNVTEAVWLYNKGDVTQHYNGWQFFRNSRWFFPIGLMDTAPYPEPVSVVYTDAIPLFALFFKLLSPILPETFQYFGIWGLSCYILQGIASAVILYKYIPKWYTLVLAVSLFTCSPWMFYRLYMHSALAAHWIILLCVLLSMNSNNLSLKRYIIFWSGLLSVASMIHVYFIPMCVVFLGCTTLYRIYKSRTRIILNLGASLLPILSAVIVLWLMGAFYGTVQFAKDALGEASANLNFLFNSVGMSDFLPALPNPLAKWAGESFGYLGLGGFLLAGIGILWLLCDKELRVKIYRRKAEIVFTGLLLVIFLWLATAPTVAWNNHVYFRWILPQPVYWVLNVFRSLGRFVWPICYVILLAAVIGSSQVSKRWMKVGLPILLGTALCLQIADFKTMINDRVSWVKSAEGYPGFHEDIWDLFTGDFQHIYVFSLDNWQELSTYAASRNLTINETYMARRDEHQIFEKNIKTAGELQNGIADPQTLYILPKEMGREELSTLSKLYIYQIDGLYVAVSAPLQIEEQYEEYHQ